MTGTARMIQLLTEIRDLLEWQQENMIRCEREVKEEAERDKAEGEERREREKAEAERMMYEIMEHGVQANREIALEMRGVAPRPKGSVQ